LKNEQNSVVVVIFSKNRALQLDLCLTGLYKSCTDEELPEIKIIYTCDELHEKSYKILEFEHPYPEFIRENDFKADLLLALKHKRYVLFLTDDTIFCGNFSFDRVIRHLDDSYKVLGVSLRLGKNTHRCYPLDMNQPIPIMQYLEENFMYFNWTKAELDFNYALEVSSSIYRVRDILPIISSYPFKNPNSLEALLYACLGYFTDKLFLICFDRSIAFANPLNRVQEVALSNRYSQLDNHDAESLLNAYMEGYRADYSKYFGMISNGCHMEVDIL